MNQNINPKPTEDSLLVLNNENELQITKQAYEVVAEMKAVVLMAKQFPRNDKIVWAALAKACGRKSFAAIVDYSYPRGSGMITGGSVNLAREAAKLYTNVRWGLSILKEDDDSVTLEGWCWDVENNVRASFQDTFKKLIERKHYENGQQVGTKWIVPNERDLRELKMRRGAIITRNAIFNVLPKDYIDDARAIAKQTLKSEIKDPEGEIKHLIVSLQKYRITVEMINGYLGHDDWDLDDIVTMNGIINALDDGTAKKDDYFPRDKEDSKGKSATDNLTDKLKKQAPAIDFTVANIEDYLKKNDGLIDIETLKKCTPKALKELGQDGRNDLFAVLEKEVVEEEEHRNNLANKQD